MSPLVARSIEEKLDKIDKTQITYTKTTNKQPPAPAPEGAADSKIIDDEPILRTLIKQEEIETDIMERKLLKVVEKISLKHGSKVTEQTIGLGIHHVTEFVSQHRDGHDSGIKKMAS